VEGKYLLIAVMLASFAFAQSAAETDVIGTGRLTETTAGNATAQGGNVTLLNLTVTRSTDRWQGFYGNISGTLALGFGSDIFYDFSGSGPTSVFASRNETFDFTALEQATAADIDTAWGYADGADQAVDIYTTTATIEGVNAPAVELEPAGSDFNSSIFDMGVSSAKTHFAFGVDVQAAKPCFDGSSCEYELMVPSEGLEVYYFFLTI